MILIISDATDRTTDVVVNWLKYQRQKVFRINSSDKISIRKIVFSPEIEITFCINDTVLLNSTEIKSYWYRRGFKNDFIKKTKPVSSVPFKELLLKYAENGNVVMNDFLFYILEQVKNRIGSIDNATNNKLVHLSIANQLGIPTPETFVCGSMKELKHFKNNKSTISKSISDGFFYEEFDMQDQVLNTFGIYANEIKNKDLDRMSSSFSPGLFQEKIVKRFELRIFYLRGIFYSMAIFSQRNNKTSIDFRRYDEDKPNHTVPFRLPEAIRKKLKKFMSAVQLDTGSIDMIYGADGNYYFLEVNPVGQFGMVSYPCNYKIEKVIANMLSQ